jgi:lactoylglutathione lyase
MSTTKIGITGVLEPAAPGVVRGAIIVRFTTDDGAATRDALAAAGVEVGELLAWPGTPPMFAFSVTETG